MQTSADVFLFCFDIAPLHGHTQEGADDPTIKHTFDFFFLGTVHRLCRLRSDPVKRSHPWSGSDTALVFGSPGQRLVLVYIITTHIQLVHIWILYVCFSLV